ncbi:MAG: MscL family protein [Nitrososphaerota archaeon]|nr:MscL family protein [Candidatus Bathyarchaeota archaeon]MDW8193625.1 MscL family protein [Nitrososphaerota archaeon]
MSKRGKDEEILQVLKDIKALLEPKPPPPAPPPRKGLWNEFIDFISKYKVLGLAVAFIMGMYIGQVVQSLVKDILMPIIGLAVPGLGNLATFRIAVPPTALDAQGNPLDPNWQGQLFGIGNFLVSIITFIIVAFVIFLIVKVTKKWGIE